MNYDLGGIRLRHLEEDDSGALYGFKNDPEVVKMLGGFSVGCSTRDIKDWIEFHRKCSDEILWAIVDIESNCCIGYCGFYKIDFRVGSAEYAIVIGNKAFWGRGIGRQCTEFALNYAFESLNLNRIYLTALAINKRAIGLYSSIGFKEEGRLREAQYKNGQYIDIIAMSVLKREYLGLENDTNK